MAETLEFAAAASEADLARALADLDAIVEEARAFIAELLRAH
jgi:hypothetical protein